VVVVRSVPAEESWDGVSNTGIVSEVVVLTVAFNVCFLRAGEGVVLGVVDRVVVVLVPPIGYVTTRKAWLAAMTGVAPFRVLRIPASFPEEWR
jgi:hypothetical protein